MSLLIFKTVLYRRLLERARKKKKIQPKSLLVPHIRQKLELCRICNIYKGYIPIFGNIKYPNMPKNIENITGISILNTDNLSDTMCQNCLVLLDQCILFRTMCRRSHKQMLQIPKIQAYKRQNELTTEKNIVARNMTEVDTVDAKDTNEELHTYKLTTSTDNITPIIENWWNKVNNQDNLPKRKRTWDQDSHRTSFSELEPWRCPNCEEKFFKTDAYLKHCKLDCFKFWRNMKPCTKTQQLCHFCGKTGTTQSIKIHMTTHLNDFPFVCSKCSFRAKTIDNLRKHYNTHSEVKKYVCSVCPYSSRFSSNCVMHMKKMHNLNPNGYKCKTCKNYYASKNSLEQHVNIVHSSKNVTKCPICHSSFTCRKNLLGHLRKQHKTSDWTQYYQGFVKGSYKHFLSQQKANKTDNDLHEVTNNGLMPKVEE